MITPDSWLLFSSFLMEKGNMWLTQQINKSDLFKLKVLKAKTHLAATISQSLQKDQFPFFFFIF